MVEADVRESTLSGEQVKAAVAELFSSALLFRTDVAALPYAYGELRIWLDGHGAKLQQQSSHRFIMTLASSLYNGPEDRQAASQMASEFLATRIRTGGSGANSQAPSPEHREKASPAPGDRTAHNIAIHFRDSSSKFSGNLGRPGWSTLRNISRWCASTTLAWRTGSGTCTTS